MGLISIPTDTKKIAANKSLIGKIKCSIFFTSLVSARIAPIINAPKPGENLARVERVTRRKQNAKETIRSISSVKIFRMDLSKLGRINIPEIKQSTTKKNSFKVA